MEARFWVRVPLTALELYPRPEPKPSLAGKELLRVEVCVQLALCCEHLHLSWSLIAARWLVETLFWQLSPNLGLFTDVCTCSQEACGPQPLPALSPGSFLPLWRLVCKEVFSGPHSHAADAYSLCLVARFTQCVVLRPYCPRPSLPLRPGVSMSFMSTDFSRY